jgi:hypothetical protein
MINQTRQSAHLVSFVQTRMRATVQNLSGKYVPGTCHFLTSNTVKTRQEPSDIIWFYGSSKTDVMHSVLTDKNKIVLADAWKNNFHNLKFAAEKGYVNKDTGSDLEGLVYILQLKAAFLL